MELSEQHPREQGLKLEWWIDPETGYPTFRATSKRTRIETFSQCAGTRRNPSLSEQHPREQGLKPIQNLNVYSPKADFQSNIQENKD